MPDDCTARRTTPVENPASATEIRSEHPPVAPILQAPVIARGWRQRFADLFPAGQFVRYLCVGGFNTLFGYGTFALTLTLLNAVVPARLLYLTVVAASLLSTPLNITVAYLGYKFFVFRTKGNYLREWLKCFAVYGTAMLPGLVILSALTRYLQSVMSGHAVWMQAFLVAAEGHLSGRPLAWLHQLATG